jgi:hypothetical protein
VELCTRTLNYQEEVAARVYHALVLSVSCVLSKLQAWITWDGWNGVVI